MGKERGDVVSSVASDWPVTRNTTQTHASFSSAQPSPPKAQSTLIAVQR